MNRAALCTVLFVIVALACSLSNAGPIKITKKHIGALNMGLKARGHTLEFNDGPFQIFTQNLDHFNSQNQQTWSQRYLVNDTFWSKPNGPVFFMLGGEGPVSTGYVNGHFNINNMAQQFGALIVALEHRYYGQSLPFGSNSSAYNLQWLSSEQALADAANFVPFINSQYNVTGKWIVFGGSYSGNLSAWARLKYPHLFAGSIASSAPVLAKLDFLEYLQVVSNSVGPVCSKAFTDASTSVASLLNSPDGRAQLSQMFNTCTSLVGANDLDVQNFWQSLSDGPSGVVQYNLDNVNYQPFNVTVMCNTVLSAADPLHGLATLTSQFQAGTCLDFNYTDMINSLQSTSDGRSWIYQTCREFGYYQTSDGTPIFGSDLPLSFSLKMCSDLFGPANSNPQIAWTNTMYGATSISTSNTFAANGDVDPWHMLGLSGFVVGIGPLQGPNSMSILIDGTAHCADLYPPREQDAPGLTTARNLELIYMNKWLA